MLFEDHFYSLNLVLENKKKTKNQIYSLCLKKKKKFALYEVFMGILLLGLNGPSPYGLGSLNQLIYSENTIIN